MPEPLTAPRFPSVDARAGHYESWFVKAHAPGQPRAFWLRHTVHQRPGRPQTASLWLTLFDAGAAEPVRAGKQTVAGADAPPGRLIRVAGAELRPGGGRGALRSPTLDAEWDFTFAGTEDEQRHLPAGWLYGAPVPRTKSATPYPGVTFAGRLAGWDLGGWTGCVSHNWGSEHAERWIWMHGGTFPGRGASTWVELVLGRVRVGRRTTPWLAGGALSLAGDRHALGGARRIRSTRVEEGPTGARIVVAGDGVRVECEVHARAEHCVCWRYADPDGSEHHTAHCSIADLRIEVRRTAASTVVLEAPMSGSYELGMRETGHGLPLQPYDDGRL